MKPGAGKRKGSNFEREFCKQLSLWWTNNADPDVFWRTHSSGGKKGVREESGDVMAIKAAGRTLMDQMHIELKCVSDTDLLLDLIRPGKGSKVIQWFEKAKAEADEYAREPLLVIKLSNRSTFCMFPRTAMWVNFDEEVNILLFSGAYLIMDWDRFLEVTILKPGGGAN